MAAEDADKDRDVEFNPIVEALAARGDSAQGIPNSVVLTGFLGEGGDGTLRLYSTLALDDCIEFDRADLLHSTTIKESSIPVSVVWVRKDAPVRQITSSTAESAFVQGPIVDSMLAGSVGDATEQQIIGTIIRTVSRLLCTKALCTRACPSRRGPCTVKSLCNSCNA